MGLHKAHAYVSLAQVKHQSSKVLPIWLALSAALCQDTEACQDRAAVPKNPEVLLWQQKVFPAQPIDCAFGTCCTVAHAIASSFLGSHRGFLLKRKIKKKGIPRAPASNTGLTEGGGQDPERCHRAVEL